MLSSTYLLTQRAYIQQEYKAMYSGDLLKRLSSELSGKLETALLLWMHDPAGRDAIILRQSLTLPKNLEAATQLICSRTPSQLHYLRQIYHSKFGVYLEHDIETNTSGDHKKVILLDPSSTLFVSFLKPYLLKTSRFRFFISSSMQDAKKIIPIIKVIYLDISKIFGGYKFTHESLLPNNLRQGSLVTRPTRLNACW